MTRVLGETARDPIPASEIEVLLSERPLDRITFTTDELTAVCPVTGQRDFYTCEIEYGGRSTLESKGLKLYLSGFVAVGITAEDLACHIAEDLGTRLDVPVRVTLTQSVRGGLTLEVVATWEDEF